MEKRDICLVMSDQHGMRYTGFSDPRVDTPELLRIAGEGQLYDRCYCNAPLCVPSRMSFLTGRLPSDLGIFNNDSSLPVDMPTIAHEMGRLGYRTVLIGRMHFKGDDQKHGFDERLCGDITSQYWGTGGKNRTEFGAYMGTTNRKNCLKAVGAGCSPVMLYDRQVYEAAMEFLKAYRRSVPEQPLFLVVGFYSPHFPFACEEALYRKYQERFTVKECGAWAEIPALSFYGGYRQECSGERIRNCAAAYCGLVERLDCYVGAVYDRFREVFADRRHLFIYTSDHGEQLGRRKIFGKQALYEDALRVPLVAAGTGIPRGVFHGTVSLLDVSRTVLAASGADEPFEWHRGRAIDFWRPDGGNRWVRVQQILECGGERVFAQAAVCGRYKELRAAGGRYVYDLEADPDERENLAGLWPAGGRDGARDHVPGGDPFGAADGLGPAGRENCFVGQEEIRRLIENEQELCARQKRLTQWGRAKNPEEWARAQICPEAVRGPVETRGDFVDEV